MRIVSWNVARRSSRLPEQAAALSRREPDVIALQEITDRTLPLWRAALARIGLPHVRASLDGADPARAPAARRHTGVLLSSRAPLTDAAAGLEVPWPETAIAAVASAEASGHVELHCVHVPNAANGWVKVRTLEAIRGGLAAAPPGPRVLCGDLNTPRRELPSGEVIDAYNRRDIDAFLEALDPEIELHGALQALLESEATVYSGHEGVRQWVRDIDEALADIRLELPEIRDLGDRIVAIGWLRARGKASGAETESPFGCVVEWRDGKATRVLSFLSESEALEAAGLSE